MRARVRAVLHGVAEFRSTITAHYPEPLDWWYDLGREAAHVVTLRRLEP
jgi:hypothetical protein